MYYVFVNPASKSDSGMKVWREAKQLLDAGKIEYKTYYTKENESIENDFNEILKTDSERPIKLIILGGDGTLNQCIEGIRDLSEVEISLIRNGSGNDFSRNKDFPSDIYGIIDGIINKRHEILVDVGLATYSDGNAPDGSHRFLVSSGFGYDAEICYNANRSPLKKVLGKLIYVFYGIKNIFTTPLTTIHANVDGKDHVLNHMYFFAAMNQPVEGGGVPMAPDATDTDGNLSCCTIYDLARFPALMLIPKIYAKKHVGKKGVTILEGKNICVRSDAPKMVHYDGETPGMYKEFKTEIIGKVKFIY